MIKLIDMSTETILQSDNSMGETKPFNANPLVQFLQKPSKEFTREDIMRFVNEKHIRMVNFRYVAGDGRLKTLNFVITDQAHLEDILTYGERVDGSSLFPFMKTGSSDLYVVPRYRTAFVNPFEKEPTLEILCSFFGADGELLEMGPENVLARAVRKFNETTGMEMKFLGELEYYVNSKSVGFFEATDQKGYHESEPFSKFEAMRKKAIRYIAACGGLVKYGHSEVGNFSRGDEAFEQHEIEFLPSDPESAAEQLVIGKWVLRMLAREMGVEISFAPKITVGKAGSGLHFHMLVEKDGKNLVLENGAISSLSKKIIAGIMDLSDALTAFGNTIPTSYLRLVPNQEAPTNICWGARNRAALVRVPLGWTGGTNMAERANPGISVPMDKEHNRQTFEFRVPDGSANIHLTIAGLMVAAMHGLQLENGIALAESLYVEGNSQAKTQGTPMAGLPSSCFESAERLESKREIFESGNIFPAGLIDYTIFSLQSFNDNNLRENLKNDEPAMRELVRRFIHCQ